MQSAIGLEASIPPKVSAAQAYLWYAESVRRGNSFQPYGTESYSPQSDLSKMEQVAYDAALEVMTMYFTGEMEYQPGLRTEQRPPDDDYTQPTEVPS